MKFLRMFFVLIIMGINSPILPGNILKLPPSQIITSALLAANGSFSYADYAKVLIIFVDSNGMVNYKRLREDRELLENFIADLGVLKKETYRNWNEKGKIAFWINAYNALTLRAVIDNYPIKSSFFTSLVYPRNSIRQIDGVWNELRFTVMGRSVTLNQIEHDILRREFNEPRIHMALVCAAKGCPPLRNSPYTQDSLDAQLDDQTRRFLADPRKFRLDTKKQKIELSPIFKWFGENFIRSNLKTEAENKELAAQRSVLEFISGYLDNRQGLGNTLSDYEIEYLDYDWSLNEQKDK